VVSVLHDLTLAGQFADRLLLLADGSVAASGPPAKVLDEAVLAAAFGGAVRVIRTADGELVVAPTRRGSGSPASGLSGGTECGDQTEEAR